MSVNKLQGFEEVKVEDKVYLFKVDFAFLASLVEVSEADPMVIYNDFLAGNANPVYVRDILQCSLRSVDGKELAPGAVETTCEDLITLYGLQEAWALTQHLLSYAMIGCVKKSILDKGNKMSEMMSYVIPFHSKNIRNRRILLALMILLFGICACFSSKFVEMLGL